MTEDQFKIALGYAAEALKFYAMSENYDAKMIDAKDDERVIRPFPKHNPILNDRGSIANEAFERIRKHLKG